MSSLSSSFFLAFSCVHTGSVAQLCLLHLAQYVKSSRARSTALKSFVRSPSTSPWVFLAAGGHQGQNGALFLPRSPCHCAWTGRTISGRLTSSSQLLQRHIGRHCLPSTLIVCTRLSPVHTYPYKYNFKDPKCHYVLIPDLLKYNKFRFLECVSPCQRPFLFLRFALRVLTALKSPECAPF